MAIAFVAAAGGASTSASLPAGVAVGDLVLLNVDGAGVTPPAGWTLLTKDSRTTSPRHYSAYRVYASGDSTSVALSGTTAWETIAYRGVTSPPILAAQGDHGESGLGSDNTTFTMATLVGASSGLVVWINTSLGTPSYVTTAPAGMTARAASPTRSSYIYDRAVPSGATPAQSLVWYWDHNDNNVPDGGGFAGAWSTAVLLRGNVAPNAPTLTSMASGGTVAAQDVNRAAHTHSDPDGDGQAAFRIRYRLIATPTPAWTQPADQSTINQFYDFPAASLPTGDHERHVQTFDGELWGPWSPSGFFTVGSRPAGSPTFVDPINGATVGTPDVTVSLSATDFDTLELRVLDAAGAVLVPIQSSTGTTFTVEGLTNSQTVTLEARKVKGTLPGQWASIAVNVSYTAPPTAQPTLTPYLADGSPVGITVVPNIPAPTSGQPAVASYALMRAEFTRGVWSQPRVLKAAQTLSPAASFSDLTVASGVEYRYLVRTDAANGTSSLSDPVDEFGGVVIAPTDPTAPTGAWDPTAPWDPTEPWPRNVSEGDYTDDDYDPTFYA